MLDPDGVAIQIDAPSYRCDALADAATTAELSHPFPPDDGIVELRRRYLGPDTRAGQGIRNSSPGGEDAVFIEAGFAPAREVLVPDGRVLERTVDDLVAMRFSSSPSAPHLFADRVAEFESDLRQLLSDASPSGVFSVRLPDNIVRIWRPSRKRSVNQSSPDPRRPEGADPAAVASGASSSSALRSALADADGGGVVSLAAPQPCGA